jgi:nucleoside-diphosphate-sugar epimerase
VKVAIVGCGDIGLRTSKLLVDGGHSVLGVRRDSSQLPDWIERVSADVTQPESLAFLSQGKFDVVIYCLAAAGFNEAAYRSAYVTGLTNTLDALGCAVPDIGVSDNRVTDNQTPDNRTLDSTPTLRRFIFVSSTSVYHQNDGSIVDENSATNPVRFNGQLVLEGERQVRDLSIGTVVRFSGIYGSGRTRMIDRVRNGVLADPDDSGYTNRIHVEDCAGVLAHLVSLVDSENAVHGNVEQGSTVKSLYLASDSTPCTRVELETFLAKELGNTTDESASRSGSVQTAAANLGLSIDPATAKSGKRIAGSKRCSNARLLDSGYRFRYPDYISGYRQVLADLER